MRNMQVEICAFFKHIHRKLLLVRLIKYLVVSVLF